MLSVKRYHEDGDSVDSRPAERRRNRLRRDLVVAIAPDEVPYPEPAVVVTRADGGRCRAGPLQTDPVPYRRRSSSASRLSTASMRGWCAPSCGSSRPTGTSALVQARGDGPDAADARHGATGSASSIRTIRAANLDGGIRHLGIAPRTVRRPPRRWPPTTPGEAAVARFHGIPPYRRDASYVSRILTLGGALTRPRRPRFPVLCRNSPVHGLEASQPRCSWSKRRDAGKSAIIESDRSTRRSLIG